MPKATEDKLGVSGELFLAFSGRWLDVTESTFRYLAQAFPEIHLPSTFREADAWCWANPRRRPRNVRRFLVAWVLREKRNLPLSEAVRKELKVGSYEWQK